MPAKLDRILIPSHDKLHSAKQLAELLAVPWSTAGTGPCAPVLVNDGLTFEFGDAPEPMPPLRFSLRVEDKDFDAILVRLVAAHVGFRSKLEGPVDHRITTEHGGRVVYWNGPDGHDWELATVSYARPA
jgi:hypothetical protein